MFKWNENRNIIKIDINYVKQVKYGMKASVIVTLHLNSKVYLMWDPYAHLSSLLIS